MKDDKTGDGLPPQRADLLFKHLGPSAQMMCRTVWKDGIDIEVPNDDIVNLCRAYAAAAVAREREQWEKVSRISIPTKTMEQEIAARVRRAVARERELCAMACDARDMGDGSREDQEARRCAEAIRKGG